MADSDIENVYRGTYDAIARIQQPFDITGSSISLAPTIVKILATTSSFAYTICENMVLKDVVRNLWSVYQYNQEYVSFLLGSLSKEDFLEISKKFAEPFKSEIDNRYLESASKIMFNILQQPLTTSDLSVLLNFEPGAINKTMIEIGYNPDPSEE